MLSGKLPPPDDEEAETIDVYQAVTLMLDAGHSYEGLGGMTPANFMGYYRAAKWLHNIKLAEGLTTAVRASVAGFRGDEKTFEQLEKQIKELRKAHNNV
ncbi:hypothetical protein [Burkholderia ubonensis]|uniref:hypothetical protein n=1 Tax=Burkholderia ubonensis TaxID=101571 RepID=UPI0007574E0E|nr:hypothetical protein [Burkholderia ubonensis]KVD63248.1 hypothetical protein WI88_09900 [Burkholderia ubonensis]